MSTTIENRVVEMRFDNAQFEQEVKTSLGTLDKLKQALSFKEIANSGLHLSGISTAITTVSEKFGVLEQIATGALRRIGDRAIDTGIGLVKSLSVDNISAGWQKFSDKTTSVGTLIAQGYDMSAVNEQLERLNWYTDETSYDFTAMVENIAKFTATGASLEDSVTAMEGIANWAALSGQNASVASRAMYQLSQAFGAGVMRREDYKSLQNVSMDTDEFRQKAIDAAIALGTLRDNLDGTYSSLVGNSEAFTKSQFVDKLTEGAWFTKDVMMSVFQEYGSAIDQIYAYTEENGVTASEALAAMGDSVDAFGLKAFKAAQEARTWGDVVDSVKDAVGTGWMNTFEQIFGDYEEAKTVWTWWANELWDVFAGGAEKRNEVLELWHQAGGYYEAEWGIYNAWYALIDVLDAVKNGFANVFGFNKDTSILARTLVDIYRGFREWTEEMAPSGVQLANIYRMASNVAKILKAFGSTVLSGLSAGFRVFSSVVTSAKESFFDIFSQDDVNGIVTTATTIKNLFDNFELGKGNTNSLKTAFRGLWSIIQLVGSAIGAFVEVFGEPLVNIFHSIIDIVLLAAGKIGSFFIGLNQGAQESNFFKNAFEKVRDILITVGEKISSVKDSISDFISALKENEKFNQFVDKLKELKDVLWDVISAAADSAFDTIKDWITGLGDKLPTAEQVANTVGDIAGKLTEFIDMIKNADYSSVKDFFDGLFSGGDDEDGQTLISTLIEKVKTVITAVFTDQGVIDTAKTEVTGFLSLMKDTVTQFFDDAFGDVGIGDILEALNLAALLRIALGLGNFFGNLSDAIEDLENIPGEILNVLKALKTTIVSYQAEINATTLLKIAGAVALLMVAIAALSFVPEEKLSTAVVALSAVLGMLILLTKAVTGLMKAKGLAAMNYLDYIGQGVGKALQNFGRATKYAAFGFAFLSVAAGLILVVGSIWSLVKLMEGHGQAAIDAIGEMLRIFALISLVIGSIGYLNMNDAAIAGFGLAMVGFGAMMLLFVKALEIMTSIEGDVVTASVIMGLFTVLIGGIIAMIGQATSISEADIKAIGSTFMKLSASLLIISLALSILAKMAPQGAISASAALVLALIGVVAALVILDKIDVDDSKVNQLLKACAALLMVSAAVSLIAASGADWKQVGMLLAAFGASLLILIGVAALVGNFVPLAVGLEVLGSAVLMIGVGMLAAGVGVLAFAAAIKMLSENAESIPDTMAYMASGIIAFGSTVQGHIPELLLFLATLMLFAVAGAVIAIAIAAVVAAVLILGAVVGKALEMIGTGINVGGTAIIMGIAALLVFIFTFIVTAIPGFIDGILKSIIILINSISLAILDNTAPLFEAIGNLIGALGRMIILGILGLLAGLLEAIPGVGTELANKLKTVADEQFGTDSDLANTIRANNEELRETVKSDFTEIGNAASEGIEESEKPDYVEHYAPTESDKASLSSAMHEVAQVVGGEYKKEIENANTPEVAKGLNADDTKAEQRAAGKALASEFNAGYSSGAEDIQPITPTFDRPESRQKYYDSGVESAGVYRRGEADGLSEPVGTTTDPADAYRGYDFSFESLGEQYGYDFSNSTAESISGNSYLPEGAMDGLNFDLSSIASNPDMYQEIFSGNMSGAASGVDAGSSDLLGSFTGLNTDIYGTMGGDGSEYYDLGYDKASNAASGLRAGKEDVSAAATEVADAVSTSFGDSYDSAFQAGSTVSFGFGAGMYSNMTAVSDAAGYISDAAAGRFDQGGTDAYNAGEGLVSQFSVGIIMKNGIAENSAQFVADNVKGKLESNNGTAMTSGQTLISNFALGVQLATGKATSSVARVVQVVNRSLTTISGTARQIGLETTNALATALSNTASISGAATQIGTMIAVNISNGINANAYRVRSALSAITSSMSSYGSGMYSKGYDIGKNFSLGMLEGISDYSSYVVNASAELAQKIAEIVKRYLKVKSPSKVAEEIGMFFDLGLALGLRKNTDTVVSASEDLGDTAVNSFNEIIARIREVMDGTIDIDPTIRPVLDLSEIQNGARNLDDLFNGSYGYAVNASSGLFGYSTASQLMAGFDSIADKLSTQKPQTNNFNITVNAGNVDDPDELADVISDRIQFKLAQIGASIGG